MSHELKGAVKRLTNYVSAAPVVTRDLAALLAELSRLQEEKEYYKGECANAQAYWRAETHHAEQAEARAEALNGENERHYAFVKRVGRLEHSADEGYVIPYDEDADHYQLDRLIAEARDLMARPLREALGAALQASQEQGGSDA